MPTITSVLGPIILHETKDYDKSAAQLLSYNIYDSRIYQSSTYYLTYDRIREIVRDPTVQLARQAVLAPIIHTPWDYKTAENAPTDAVEFVQNNLEPLRDWYLQSALYGALDFGWAPFEIIYEPKQAQIWIKDLKRLLQDYTTILVYMDTGRFAGFTNEPLQLEQIANNVEIHIPYAMNINLVVEGTDWYGISTSWALDPICEAWDDTQATANRYDKKIAGATWVVYYPVGETPIDGELTSNAIIARRILATLEASGAVAIPDEIQEFLDDSVERELKGKWRVELITTSSSTQASFVDRQKYLDNLKMRIFGIPERAILEGKFGTKAEAETHSDIALSTIDTKHRLICDQTNMQLIRPLLRFNYGEEYQDSVWIEPAPLVDAQFQTVKEIYRLLIQNPNVVLKEVQNIDVPSLRNQIGIPTVEGAPNDYEIEPPMSAFGQKDDKDEDDNNPNKSVDKGEKEEPEE